MWVLTLEDQRVDAALAHLVDLVVDGLPSLLSAALLSEVINVYHHKPCGKLDLQDSWLLGILDLLDDVALQVVWRVVQTAVLSASIQPETPLRHCQVP